MPDTAQMTKHEWRRELMQIGEAAVSIVSLARSILRCMSGLATRWW